jgi:membrane protease subunit (stomatin/prohibitin family)
VCEYCFSGRDCSHGEGSAGPSRCACSIAGTPKCPDCGCECASWDWGLGFVGPGTIRSFFGVGDDENPGFSNYPASKSQLVAAARSELEEAEASPTDVEWLSRTLPDGTYRDRGEVIAALTPVLSWAENDASSWVVPLPMQAVAVGTRLVVGKEQVAAFVARDGRVLDSFGPGEHPVTRESAPRAAAQSRPPAPGFPRSTISATPFFGSTRERRADVNRTAHLRSGESVQLRGSVTFSVASLADLLARIGTRSGAITADKAGATFVGIVGPALDQAFASHDLREFTGSSDLLDQAIRSAAAQSGLRVSAVAFEPIRPLSVMDQMAAMHEHQRQAMAQMPPEMQAMIQARMAQAMAQAQASRGSMAGGPPTGSVSRMTPPPGPAPAPAPPCPSCHAPNPPDVKFCQNCGQPLRATRACPRCGHDVAPGVKFCGNCGSPLG